MAKIRRPAVAGAFYPMQPEALDEEVRHCLSEAGAAEGPAPKALIAPHAGYIYSGSIAGEVYAQLRPARDKIARIVLIGPSHCVPFEGLAVSSAEWFETPLGVVPVDCEAVEQILRLPQVQVLDEAHAGEHSLEVQLPFLQIVLNEFSIVPIVVGEATAEAVAEVLDMLWSGSETRIVVSSDLSHYHDYETARRIDAATSEAIEALQPERIKHDHACGRNPIAGLLLTARKRGLHVRLLDLRNSGDTAGPRDQVVGYGAYAVG